MTERERIDLFNLIETLKEASISYGRYCERVGTGTWFSQDMLKFRSDIMDKATENIVGYINNATITPARDAKGRFCSYSSKERIK